MSLGITSLYLRYVKCIYVGCRCLLQQQQQHKSIVGLFCKRALRKRRYSSLQMSFTTTTTTQVNYFSRLSHFRRDCGLRILNESHHTHSTHCNTLQHTATHCNTRHHTTQHFCPDCGPSTDGGDRNSNDYECQNFQQIFTQVPVHIKQFSRESPNFETGFLSRE